MTQENGKIATLSEGIAESTTACLVMMVQGNMLAVTLGHLAIAVETGIIAGTVASILVFVAHARTRWIISTVLGAVTAVVDFFVHSGQFGTIFAEALATGLGAGLLSYLVGMAIHFFRAHH